MVLGMGLKATPEYKRGWRMKKIELISLRKSFMIGFGILIYGIIFIIVWQSYYSGLPPVYILHVLLMVISGILLISISFYLFIKRKQHE
jgi:LPXTG-motif cell wall-anchored protein